MNQVVNCWLLREKELRDKIKKLEERLEVTTSQIGRGIFVLQKEKEAAVLELWEGLVANTPLL